MRPVSSYDVVIAGAGPAGTATAMGLLRAGVPAHTILCLDRAQFPRPKPCGGGLTGRATEALEAVGLQLRVPSAACFTGRLVYGSRRARVRLERPVRIVRREELDQDLLAQARGTGLEVAEGEGLAGFHVDRTAAHVRIATTRGRTLTARVLVGADGAGSVVRRTLLGDQARAQGQPLRLCRLELPDPGLPAGEMVYDFSAMADGLRGYVWIFPVPGGRINVGALHFPASALGGRALDALLSRALSRFGVRLPGPARGWPVWPYDAMAPVAAAHALLVGDAAGVDALTGEGIAVALDHGAIAAGSVCRALTSGRFGFEGYAAELRRATVGRELALDDVLARLLYGAPDPRVWLGLVMEDERMQRLYADRVCGARVLADDKPALLGVLARHLFLARGREARLRAALP